MYFDSYESQSFVKKPGSTTRCSLGFGNFVLFKLICLRFFASNRAKGRHFHVGDFEEMGRHFCEVLLEYSEAKSSDR